MFGNDDFIWQFGISLNLLFGNSKIFTFGFESNSTIEFKIVKVVNLKMTIQILSLSNSSYMILIIEIHIWNEILIFKHYTNILLFLVFYYSHYKKSITITSYQFGRNFFCHNETPTAILKLNHVNNVLS